MGPQEVLTTEKQIRDVLSKECCLDEVEVSDHLEADHGLDSLDMTELYMALEDKFAISIPEDDWDNLKTVHQITAYINKKVQ